MIALARSQRSRTAAPPFDGLNIGLCDDPDPAGGAVQLQPVRYFDMMASNYLAGHQWRSRRLGRVVADISRHLIADDGRLIPLNATELGNQVGVSTVALTSDGWMVLVHQGVASRSSAGLVAPSGSGSLEPVDIDGRDRLPDVIAAGMERELREELGLISAAMRDVRIETTVLGYGRWLEKGAKPEFYGVSRIHAAMRDLDVRIDRVRAAVRHQARADPAGRRTARYSPGSRSRRSARGCRRFRSSCVWPGCARFSR